ncbi:UBX-domain-containing protein [Anaeromyces robustus]|uniref:UBX-domain-containing protein n=1 Tax=Anaeromyces robustus TaxID=1754192 RepID=A0A1Y1W5Q2_9FUNG|nr:UBX-domain-containing protein [Anaeromyces robustus]|eukprot:ORX68863.1 UBX-domain-containing protein [Anaeromyces robustus]
MEYLDSLTDNQREVLESFQNLSGEDDLEKTIKLLQRFNWDLESAYQYYFGGELDNDDSTSSSRNNLINNNRNNNNRQNNHGNNQVSHPIGRLFELIFSPVRIAISILKYIFDMFPNSFKKLIEGSDQHRSARMTCAEKFIQYFEENYGEKHPTFYRGTYKQALLDIKDNYQILVVIVNSPEHDDTPEFCRNVISSDVFIDYLKERNFVVWAGSVNEIEGYKVNNVFGVTTYPFIGLVAHQRKRPIISEKIEGLQPVEDIIQKIDQKYEQLSVQLQSELAEQREREQSRIIRQEQESAYEESLRKDRERERKEKLERERKQREEELARQRQMEYERKVEEKRKYKQRLAESLPPEPNEDECETAQLSIRFPDGSRVIRSFRADDKLQIVYDFVESKDLGPLDILSEIILVNTFPRKEYTEKDQTLESLGLCPSSSLIVEEKDDEESEE